MEASILNKNDPQSLLIKENPNWTTYGLYTRGRRYDSVKTNEILITGSQICSVFMSRNSQTNHRIFFDN